MRNRAEFDFALDSESNTFNQSNGVGFYVNEVIETAKGFTGENIKILYE